MTVSIRDAAARPDDLAWIERHVDAYLTDLGRASTGVFRTMPEFGHIDTSQVRSWLSEPRSTLITIVQSGHPAGFARIVRQPAGAMRVDYRMADFFIDRVLRRRGLGIAAVRLILQRFAGNWEVVAQAGNHEAVAFWRRTVGACARDGARERSSGGEIRQYFSSGGGLRKFP